MKLNKFYAGTNPDSKVISQGILFPMSILPKEVSEETDVTEMLKITKVEDETKETRVNVDNVLKSLSKRHWFLRTKLGKYLMKYNWFRNFVKSRLLPHFREKKYPTYIVKTDETRIQNMPRILETYRGVPLQVTEKLDGTSTTFGLEKIGKDKFDFAVCSRNVRQLDRSQKTWYMDSEVNYYWEMSDKYNVQNFMLELFKRLDAKTHIYIQGETIGPSIQGNKYNLKEREFRAFNVVVDGKKLNSLEGRDLLQNVANWVPVISEQYVLPDNIPALLEYANGKSVLYDTLREGIVIRDAENTVSFKVISPEFMIKHSL